MKILSIDTSTKFLSLGISEEDKIYEYNLELSMQMSNLLSITIKRALDALGWQINDIDYLACGLGPGSFTGIRVGLATIKGLSWSLKKPIAGISTLDILARGVSPVEQTIIPIIDAKRGLLYCSFYKNKNGTLKRIAPYLLLKEEDFFHKAPNNSIILGDGLNLYKEKLLRNIKGATLLEKDYWYPKGRNIIALAKAKIQVKRLNNPFNIRPIYLYPKECQIKIKNQNAKIKMTNQNSKSFKNL